MKDHIVSLSWDEADHIFWAMDSGLSSCNIDEGCSVCKNRISVIKKLQAVGIRTDYPLEKNLKG